jgi:hypothetical protein
MRGDDRQQAAIWSDMSPEQRVPADHPLRPIRAMVDTALAERSVEFAKLYSPVARPSIPPEKLLRALLLQVLYSVRSEGLLMEPLEYNLCGIGLLGRSASESGALCRSGRGSTGEATAAVDVGGGSCAQTVPNSSAFLITPAHSSVRGRRKPCVSHQTVTRTYTDRDSGLKILVSVPAHSSALVITPAHSSAHVFVEDRGLRKAAARRGDALSRGSREEHRSFGPRSSRM